MEMNFHGSKVTVSSFAYRFGVILGWTMPCGAAAPFGGHECPGLPTLHTVMRRAAENLHINWFDGGARMSGDGWSEGGLWEKHR